MATHHFWIYPFIIGFGTGVLWRSFFDFGYSFIAFLLLLAATLFFIGRNEIRILFLSLGFFATALGIIRFDLGDTHAFPPETSNLVGKEIILTGIIATDPDIREESQYVMLRNVSIEDQLLPTKVLVQTDRFIPLSYGDEVSVHGTLTRPEAFTTSTGRLFDYRTYLSKDGIGFIVYRGVVDVVGTGGGNSLLVGLFTVKHTLLQNIQGVIREPEAGLLAGELFGEKKALSDEWIEIFQKTGVIHIVVLSGYNITIIASALMWFLGKVGQIGARPRLHYSLCPYDRRYRYRCSSRYHGDSWVNCAGNGKGIRRAPRTHDRGISHGPP